MINMNLSTLIIEFIISLVAVMGFAYSFSAPKEAVIFGGISGAVGWTLYYVLLRLTKSLYISATLSALLIGILGEIFARKFLMPSSCFTIPGILALCPGTAIYYTITHFIANQNSLAMEKLFEVIVISGSISFGILLSSVTSKSLRNFKNRNPKRNSTFKTKINNKSIKG